MTINCRGESLILSKDRAIYWDRKKILIISDIHLGKGAHFRNAGIQVPSLVNTADLDRLTHLLLQFRPDCLLVTGDMFHYQMNSEVILFSKWRAQYPNLKIILIKGNHDSLAASDYEGMRIETHSTEFLMEPFRFIHHQPAVSDEYYNITGHIHPGVILHGKARQQLKLPCFYFGKTCAILPAFSIFTGLSKIKSQEGDQFYAITPQKIFLI